MKCARCQWINPFGVSSCRRCGERMAEPAAAAAAESKPASSRPCLSCGAEMPSAALYCGVCGESMRKISDELAASEPASVVRTATMPGPSVGNAEHDQAVENTLIREESTDANEPVPAGMLREMVLIPTCRFLMGAVNDAAKSDEIPPHYVKLSSFHIDRCTVTNAEFEQFRPDRSRVRAEVADGDDDPVVFVTHADCLDYCRWRSDQEGLPSDAYSLPTEAQWECAARGGLPNRIYPWGNELRAEICNTRETGPLRTLPSNQGIPNAFGLFWIGSNVREWCRDWYQGDYYRMVGDDILDPAGPDPIQIVNMTVIRGASFQDPAYELGRCAARNYAHRDNSANDVGFRCVRRAD